MNWTSVRVASRAEVKPHPPAWLQGGGGEACQNTILWNGHAEYFTSIQKKVHQAQFSSDYNKFIVKKGIYRM
jgi:hypothetical protein